MSIHKIIDLLEREHDNFHHIEIDGHGIVKLCLGENGQIQIKKEEFAGELTYDLLEEFEELIY